MSRGSRLALAAIVPLLLLASCAARQEGPPTVRWGVDECSHCHMILGDERFAAVARNEAGEGARFDDLGCMLRWLAERDAEAWQVWAHDAGGPGWLSVEGAWYTRDERTLTPMGSGLRAWPSRAAAAAAGGTASAWAQLRQRPLP